jgi:sortase A
MSIRLGKLTPVVLVIVSLVCFLNAGAIHAKASIAQLLMGIAWQKTVTAEQPKTHKPWPWADTWPVARLRSESHGVDLIVLAGSHGEALAFGPGLQEFTPEHTDNSQVKILAGHRDTHFKFLQKVSVGDTVSLQNTDGIWHNYRVDEHTIVTVENGKMPIPNAWLHHAGMVVLATCYPFEGIASQSQQRLLVLLSPTPEGA